MPLPNQEEVVRPAGARKYTEEKGQLGVFLSFCERNPENEYLVERLVEPFLSELDFDVHYYKKDRSVERPSRRIDELIDRCEIVIGFYTKDEKKADGSFSAADNVVAEMNQATEKKRLGLVEEGTVLGSLDFTRISSIDFTREKYGKLLVDLLVVLKNSGLLNIQTS